MEKIPKSDRLFGAEDGNNMKKAAETRRQTRRRLEKNAIDNEPDKIQLRDIMLASLVLVAAAVSFTDFTLSLGSLRNFTALSAFLYIVTTMVYRNCYAKGKQQGRRDSEYISALEEYREKRKDIYDRGLAGRVPEFCKQYKVRELREYREGLLADIEMDYEEYKGNYQRMSNTAIMMTSLPGNMKKALIECNNAKPLRMTPSLILNENGDTNREKLFGQSGREREIKDKKRQVIQRAVAVIFGGVIVINVILDLSLMTLFQWAVRMLPVIFAIITGSDDGFCNVTVTETNFKNDQVAVINLFNEYVEGEHKNKSGED